MTYDTDKEAQLIAALRKAYADLKIDSSWALHSDMPEAALWKQAADALEARSSASSPSPHLLAVLRRARSYIDNHGAFIAESEMLRQIDHQLSLYVVEKT